MSKYGIDDNCRNLMGSLKIQHHKILHGLFLSSQTRATISIQADGNCFFRALSFILYGHEDCHQEIREQLVQFISSNKEVIRKFVTFLSLKEHLKKMLTCNTWATQVEINAAASFLQIPLYICTQRTMSLLYYWEVGTVQTIILQASRCDTQVQCLSCRACTCRKMSL